MEDQGGIGGGEGFRGVGRGAEETWEGLILNEIG